MEEPNEALAKVRRHVRILVEIGRIAGVGADLSWFLDQLLVQVARAIEIDHVKVLQYRPKQADFIVAAGIGGRGRGSCSHLRGGLSFSNRSRLPNG
jgi:hypothetical protein